MFIDITEDKLYMQLSSPYPVELNIIRDTLRVARPNAWLLQKKGINVPSEIDFMNAYNFVPIGLWVLVFNICKERNICVNLSPSMQEFIGQFKLNYDDFKAYVDETFEGAENDKGQPFKPYEYQIQAAYNLIKFKKCCGEISTSGGKTLISFIIFKYYIDVCGVDNILYIVPSVDLATQSAEQYERYESYLKVHHHNWQIGILKGGLKKKERELVEKCNILFGTYQSLCKKEDAFFERFQAAITDECHHTISNSIRQALANCINLQYSIGVTGTFPKEREYDGLTIQSVIGPVVYHFTANQLINVEKRGTPIYVVIHLMNWATEDEKKLMYHKRRDKDSEDVQAGAKVMKEEQNFINASYTREKYIADLAIKSKKNVLVLFGDVKTGYGKKLYQYIKDNSDKTVFYVDGNTKSANRKYFEEEMENDLDGNTVMVASIGTMGEGIDLKNLWCILLVNTVKSDRLVRQICGRGLRQFEGKDKVVLMDFVDDLRYSDTGKYCDNYMWKHYKERKKIYKEQNFPIFEQVINFEDKTKNGQLWQD